MKKVKIITIILAIVLITMVAFWGIYVPVQNRMENKVKDYAYAMDLKGDRTVKLSISTETTTVIKDADGKEVEDADDLTDEQLTEKGYKKEEIANNSDEVKTVENYMKTKNVIEKRLKKVGVDNYTIKVDDKTGDIIIELPENDNTDTVISNLTTVGKFEIVDTETKEVLMNNQDIKKATVMYGSDTTQTGGYATTVCLDIEFTKEGTKKLEDISNNYKEVKETDEENNEENTTQDENTTENTTEENTTETENTTESEEASEEEEETKEKTVTMNIDDQEIMSTSFDEPIETGKLRLSIGSATSDVDTLNDYVTRASNISTILETGEMPIEYELEDNTYIISEISDNTILYAGGVLLAIVVVAFIVFIIKFKMHGLLGAISCVGLISLFLLTIRYTNVVLSIQGLLGIALIVLLNLFFIYKLLSNIEKNIDEESVKNATKNTYKEFFIKIIPIIIMVIVFSFVKWAPISSFGMVMFWGITIILIYNWIITCSLLKINAKKEKQN